MRVKLAGALISAAFFGTVTNAHAQGGAYVNFESIPNRPVELSPDGTRLFVTNTPDGRLEIFNVATNGSLTAAGSVTVGLDPVAVKARSNSEVWVVNGISDSVSIVDVSATPARVVRTLLVGDEPRDIVFAGTGGNRAFITAARRGQNHPANTVADTQTEGLPRADVWVFDANNLGTTVGGTPLAIIQLFADKPGSMTTSPDGRTVFVGIATSGNQTSVVGDAALCGTNGQAGSTQNSNQGDGPCRLPNGTMSPGGNLAPNTNQVDGARNPRTGNIVRFNRATGAWLDAGGRDFRGAMNLQLPDNDVFTIDAMANPPRQSAAFATAGTLNASLAAHPTNGRVYMATIDAINTNRFLSLPTMNLVPNPSPRAGVARTADPATGRTLNGHLYESRIAIIQAGQPVVSRHLNKHINYEVVPTPANSGTKERSIADPRGLVFSPDGSTLFVSGLGSNAIASYRTAELDNDSFVPSAANFIRLSGTGGPTDLVIDEAGARLYVYKRFDNSVAVIDVAARRETQVLSMASPEPTTVTAGRRFFYDAQLTSSNGEANCNVCHPNADKDDLAWDLGTPFLGVTPNNNRFTVGGNNGNRVFSPLKGPMTVLTLRGIKDSGPMFWRGDITSANQLDERANFQGLNVVFPALLGREAPLPAADFSRFTDWALSLVPPPNPHRALSNVLNASQLEGMAVFTGQRGPNDGPFNCNTCHTIDPAMSFLGTRGENTIEGETQEFKVTQLRTTYDKVGMFGQNDGGVGDNRTNGGPRVNTGPQIRGTGTLHDGSAGGPEDFLTAGVFALTAAELRQVVDFVYAFPSNLASVVGQQVTLTSASGPDAQARVDLLQARAAVAFVLPGGAQATECDLVAKATIGNTTRGFLFQTGPRSFLDDTGRTVAAVDVRALARTPGQEVTFTCVYPGGGRRFGIDRNLDGTLDGAGQPPVMQPPVMQPPVMQPPVMQPPVMQPQPQPQQPRRRFRFIPFIGFVRVN